MTNNRGVGYCLNIKCEHYGKGTFLLNPKMLSHFKCALCKRNSDHIKIEKWWKEGTLNIYKRAVVEFDYSISDEKFHKIAVVEDDDVCIGSEIRLQSPVITTDKRALVVAERLLSSVLINPDIKIINLNETLLDYDLPKKMWAQKLSMLEKTWLSSPRQKVRTFSD